MKRSPLLVTPVRRVFGTGMSPLAPAGTGATLPALRPAPSGRRLVTRGHIATT